MFDDVLSYLGDTLEKPGRAVRGLLGGRPEEAAALIPFSDSLGLTDRSNAVSGEDLFKKHFGPTGSETADSVLGFGVDMLTDPLTYAGGFLGRMGGKALGRGLEESAIARGPQYKTELEELMKSIPADAMPTMDRFKGKAGLGRAMDEIPEGSQYLGHGADAVAFRAPDGSVTRLTNTWPDSPTRMIDPNVLPTTRAADIQSEADRIFRVERGPYASKAPEGFDQDRLLNRPLASRGIDFVDDHPQNFGMHQGRPVVIDSGSLDVLKPGEMPYESIHRKRPELEAGAREWASSMAHPAPQYAPTTTFKRPDRMTAYLLDLLGGTGAMQKALSAGQAAPGYERLLGTAGTIGGAAGGAGLGRF